MHSLKHSSTSGMDIVLCKIEENISAHRDVLSSLVLPYVKLHVVKIKAA